MKQFKRAKVVMLPTKEKAGLVINPSTNKIEHVDFVKDVKYYTDASFNCYQLFITSDEEIKEGDWYYWSVTNTIQKAIKDSLDRLPKIEDGSKKIIATTDSSLKVSRENSHPNSVWKLDGALLPQPSQSFIEKYVEEYNKGNIITDVLVEYEVDKYDIRNQYQDSPSGKYWEDEPIPKSPNNLYTNAKYFIPKINPKDNTITIKKVKDSWSRDELQFMKGSSGNHIEFIYQRLINVHNENPNYDYMLKLKELSNWVKENL